MPFDVSLDRGDIGRRLDLVLTRHLTTLSGASRSRIQRWIAEGRVAVNGQTTRRPAARVAHGDHISIAADDLPRRVQPTPEEVPLLILYEDDELLVLNKPAGLVVHPAYRHGTGTLLNGVLWHARSWPGSTRPSIVGRLDKMTSGLVLVAKSPAIHATLQRTLRLPASMKTYLAVVQGHVKPARGDIDLPLSREAHDRRRVTVTPEGAPSRTSYVRLDRSDRFSLVQCRLLTGRLHQIRVHLAAKGWPIVGDATYGADAPAYAFPRQALHAWRVTFAHPATGCRVEVQAPLPADMLSLMAVAGLRAPA